MPKPCYSAVSIDYKWLSGCVRCDENSTVVKLQNNTNEQFSSQDAEKLCDSRGMTSSCLEQLDTKAYRRLRDESKSKLLWTGVVRHNETHFHFKDRKFRIPEHLICDGYSSVYPFKSAVVLSISRKWNLILIENGTFTAVSNN